VFQSLAITASTAITFETIGRSNPLAATTYCLMVSAFNIANTYMLIVDGWGYAWRGVAGSYVADASLSVATCLLLAAILAWLSRRQSAEPAGQPADTAGPSDRPAGVNSA
jgi:PAT family beta-lactamase induction signal transducer AmpG